MALLPTSGIRLFRAFGIQVYLHWSWLIVFMIEIQARKGQYSSQAWNIAEYLSLFVIVLLHEFGHALACRSVGGQADRIMLWPLGGVAFVSPPQRPGAVLWSIVAGPLVNVLLIVPTVVLLFVVGGIHQYMAGLPLTNVQQFALLLASINLGLLVFNMLPVYPLDGGQILRALLWFRIGARKSLLATTFVGVIGAALGAILSLYIGSLWLVVMAGFIGLQSWAGFQRAKMMSDESGQVPSRADIRCPSCGISPPPGAYWTCTCGHAFDVFAHKGVCPNCGGMFAVIPCPACQNAAPPNAWVRSAFSGPVKQQPVASRG